ncbi:MAG: SUMF1/EgtB/PvdO family nonheme iron enzyme, partial [Kiritimatiellia bacterium]|nr:SUMF1/EgtB/PvdO family nonheme iron enzyme [Kiritimatiellia bacterium]
SLVSPAMIMMPLVLLAFTGCKRGAAPSKSVAASTVITTPTGIEMVRIPSGTFEMGCRNGKGDEMPVHPVQIDAFLMDRTEVTQEQLVKMEISDPSHFKDPENPVEQVNWMMAVKYCNCRSIAEKLEPCYNETTVECNFQASGYRLPTEAEWEYACRAGTSAEYSFGNDQRGLDKYMWFSENSIKKTHPVGQKKANAWGLFDMHGNVAEWCNDIYDKDYYKTSQTENPRGPASGKLYVLRGGAWSSSPERLRSSARVGENPGFTDACLARDTIGFRCVRKVPIKQSEEKASTNVAPTNTTSAQSPPLLSSGLSPTETPKLNAGNPPRSGKTGLVYGNRYLEHMTGAGHPERPERLTAIIHRLESQGLLSNLVVIPPSPIADEWLTTVHSPSYVAEIARRCMDKAGFAGSSDTPISEQSYAVAREAAGGVLAAIDAVMTGRINNAFCAVRPPGHHASKNKAMGFCLFNNIAIATRYLQKQYKLKKILIVDWDVHHGNGTQDAFYDDPTVFYFSVHQHPFYPGSGKSEEQGTGKGYGYTLNAPLPAGSGDETYLKIFQGILKPKIIEFQPDFILISAGFDAHKDDPLGGMQLTPEGFAQMTAILKELAENICNGRMVSVLEGGYDLEGLSMSVSAHIAVLLGVRPKVAVEKDNYSSCHPACPP